MLEGTFQVTISWISEPGTKPARDPVLTLLRIALRRTMSKHTTHVPIIESEKCVADLPVLHEKPLENGASVTAGTHSRPQPTPEPTVDGPAPQRTTQPTTETTEPTVDGPAPRPTTSTTKPTTQPTADGPAAQPGAVVTNISAQELLEVVVVVRTISEYINGDVAVVKDLFGKVCASDQVKFLPLSAQFQCVLRLDKKMVVLSYADHKKLFLIIINPHKAAKLPESFVFVEKLSVIADDEKNTKLSFSVYSAPYSPTAEDRTRVSSAAATFVLDALQQHLLEETDSLTAHGLLKSRHFLETSRICMGDDAQICIAASQTDFNYLSSRFVDYRGRRPFLSGADLLDCENVDAWDESTNCVILIGGESGSGKTWEMIANFHKRTDLTVYIRPLGDDEFNGTPVILPEEWKLLNDPDSCQRDSCFHTCVARAVEKAIEAVCPPLSSKLKEYIGPSPFRVRICFDEIGGSPTLAHACCSLGGSSEGLRTVLGWTDKVEIRVFAGGTGVVGTVGSPVGGSEHTRSKLTILNASRGGYLYWKYRSRVFEPFSQVGPQNAELVTKFNALRRAVDAVCAVWSAEPDEQRVNALSARDALLWEAFELDYKSEGKCRSRLIGEAIFAAVESDGECALALGNSRLAALIVAQCRQVAEQMLTYQICARAFATNVRHDVLQPVVKLFRRLNALQAIKGDDACTLLVESFRYAIFDGYASTKRGYGANDLMTRRGVLVDNSNVVEYDKFDKEAYVEVTHLSVVPEAPPTAVSIRTPASRVHCVDDIPTHIACYRKDLGRFSISPAMVVVLSNSMPSAFEETFSNIGDVFERAVAKFLYFATLVFFGRPVGELVNFIAAPLAIIGSHAQAALDSERCISFDSLELRISGSLNADHLVSEKTSKGNRYKAEKQFAKLWRGNAAVRRRARANHQHCAWIEISPPSLPSADVVLHIPGVITLPFQCKDVGQLYEAEQIRNALSSMRRTEAPKAPPEAPKDPLEAASMNRFAEKLHALGAPVVPVLYMSRAWYISSDMIKERMTAVGEDCIWAFGIVEPQLRIPSHYNISDAQRCKRHHRVRRGMLLFDFKREASEEVDVVAGPYKPPLLVESDPAHRGSFPMLEIVSHATEQQEESGEDSSLENIWAFGIGESQ